jgi:aspartate/methionine/tyrosine aminotransferase
VGALAPPAGEFIARLLLVDRVQFEPFDLLDRVIEGQVRAKYNLSTSDMPPTKLSEVIRLPDMLLSENHPGGSEMLRGLLADRFGGRPEDYIVTCGASEANFAVQAALVRPGDNVLVEAPTYQPLLSISAGLGARVHRVERREEEDYPISADAVQEALPNPLRLLVFSNLNNPTGVSTPGAELRALADLAAERDFYIFVDEMFRELAFEGPVPTMGGMSERVIITSGVSKFYGAGGLRIGWIRATGEARAAIRRVLDYLSIAPSGISERIAVALLKKKARTESRNRRMIREGRGAARAWAESVPGVGWYESAGNLVFPRLPVESAPLASLLLAKYDTFLAPGESFGRPRHFRLNVASGLRNLEQGLQCVTEAMSEL